MSRSKSETPLTTQLMDWAKTQADASGGRFGVLPHNPGRYPAQDAVVVRGNGAPAQGVVDMIAAEAQPGYETMVQQLRLQEQQNGVISNIGQLIKGGNNVVLATNHADLTDVAIAQAAVCGRLQELEYSSRTAIVIGKMVAFLTHKTGDVYPPIVDILKILEDEIFLSFPRTETAKSHGIGELLSRSIDIHNIHMRLAIAHSLGQGGLLLALAPSGSIDKVSDGQSTTVQMGPMSHGTTKMLQQDRTYVVPVAVWGKPNDTPVLDICDTPQLITGLDVLKSAMQSIARELNQRVPGTTFTFAT